MRSSPQLSMEFAVQTGGRAVLPCPYEVGALSECYFGAWFKNGTKIVEVQRPSAECSAPRSFQVPASVNSEDAGRYSLDHSSFTLIISDAKPSDSSNYQCQLSSVDPATTNGQTIDYALSIAHILSVGGKFICGLQYFNEGCG